MYAADDPPRPAASHLRIARPARDLARTERFWAAGLGLRVLERIQPQAEGEHELVMLGWPGAAWHLELVADPEGQTPPAPTVEDLLGLYLGLLLGAHPAPGGGGRADRPRPQPLLGAVGHHHRRPRWLPARAQPPELAVTGG